MSLLFTASFDDPQPASRWDLWDGNNVISLAAGRNGTNGLSRVKGGSGVITVASKAFVAGSNRVIAGAWLWRDNDSVNTNNALIELRSNTGSFIQVRMGGINQLVLEGTGLPGGTNGEAVGPPGPGQMKQWVFVELLWEPGVALELRANTETIHSTVPSDGDGTPAQIRMQLGEGTRFWEDIYLIDTATPAPNNFLGPVKIQNLTPDGAGFRTELTPSGVGGNWEMVNDGSDATYVEGDATEGDLYAFEDVSGSEPVLGVVQFWRAFDSEGGAIIGRSIVRTDATEFDGDDAVLGGSVQTRVQEWGINPDTGLAWTPAEVNAAEFGVEFDT